MDARDLERRDAMKATASEMKVDEIIMLQKNIRDRESQIIAANSVKYNVLKEDLSRQCSDVNMKIKNTTQELKDLKKQVEGLKQQMDLLDIKSLETQQIVGDLVKQNDSASTKLAQAIGDLEPFEVVDVSTVKAVLVLGSLYESQEWNRGRIRIRAWVSEEARTEIRATAALFEIIIID